MTAESTKPETTPLPALWPALASMTLLQAIVSLALFTPGVLAPRLGIGEGAVSAFAFGCFATGIFGALQGGVLVGALGSFRVAAGCMIAVAGAMLLGMIGDTAALLLAGLVLGLAFGPETPASSALLARLARPEQRALVFSLRQCGNQIGAILGSLTLPLLAMLEPRAGYLLVVAIAGLAALLFVAQAPRYDPLVRQAARGLRIRDALSLLQENAKLRRLALFSAPLSALQLGLNAYLVTYLVGTLALEHITAGAILGIAQAGGLVGRLGWGIAAARLAPMRLIALVGASAGFLGGTMAVLPAGMPLLPLALVAFGFGLTASGWNGVFLGEVAASAPAGRAGEATGAVLTASYAGLLLGPGLIAALSAISGLRLAYLFLAASAILASLWLLRSPHE